MGWPAVAWAVLVAVVMGQTGLAKMRTEMGALTQVAVVVAVEL